MALQKAAEFIGERADDLVDWVKGKLDDAKEEMQDPDQAAHAIGQSMGLYAGKAGGYAAGMVLSGGSYAAASACGKAGAVAGSAVGGAAMDAAYGFAEDTSEDVIDEFSMLDHAKGSEVSLQELREAIPSEAAFMLENSSLEDAVAGRNAEDVELEELMAQLDAEEPEDLVENLDEVLDAGSLAPSVQAEEEPSVSGANREKVEKQAKHNLRVQAAESLSSGIAHDSSGELEKS